jgi:hypothetical protein
MSNINCVKSFCLNAKAHLDHQTCSKVGKHDRTHSHSDRVLSCIRIFGNEEQLYKAWVTDCQRGEKQSLNEHLDPNGFCFFLEFCADVEEEDISTLCRIASRTLAKFVPMKWLRMAVLFAATPNHALTRLRLVYYDLVVNHKMAIAMHAMVKWTLFREAGVRLRRILSGGTASDDIKRETSIDARWGESLPSQQYTSQPEGLAMIGSYHLISCPSSISSHDTCPSCLGSRKVENGKPLYFHMLVDERGEEDQESHSSNEQTNTRDTIKVELMKLTAIRTPNALNTEWRMASGCPIVPLVAASGGRIRIAGLFTSEKDSDKVAGRTLVSDARLLSTILSVVRKQHTTYEHLFLRSVWKRVIANKSLEYDVYVDGEGSTYCHNARSFHCDEEPRGGRVFFKITTRGISQRCFCMVTPQTSRVYCPDYAQHEHPLDVNERMELGYFDTKPGSGDSHHRLICDYIPNLIRALDGKESNGKRGRDMMSDDVPAYVPIVPFHDGIHGWDIHDFPTLAPPN